MIIVIASVAVALVVFILYALDRKARGEPISWEQAGKLSLFGGLITSGVVFTTTMESAPQTIAAAVADAQDMFVGTPAF
jgi:hypothetical protein